MWKWCVAWKIVVANRLTSPLRWLEIFDLYFRNENRKVIGTSCEVFFWFFYNVLPDLLFISGFIPNWLWILPFISLLSRITSVLKGLSEGAHKSVWYPGLLLNGILGYLSTYVTFLWVEGDCVQPDLNSIPTNVRYHVKNIDSITGVILIPGICLPLSE